MVVPDLVVEAPPGANVVIRAIRPGGAQAAAGGGGSQQQPTQSADPCSWGIRPDVVNREKLDWEGIRREHKILALILLNTNDEESRTCLDHLSLLDREFKDTNQLALVGVTDEADHERVRHFVHDRELEIKFPFCIDRGRPTLTECVRDKVADKKTLPLAVVYDQDGRCVWSGEPRKLGLETTIRELVSAGAQRPEGREEQGGGRREQVGAMAPKEAAEAPGVEREEEVEQQEEGQSGRGFGFGGGGNQERQRQQPQGRWDQGWTGAETRGKPDDSIGGGWERPASGGQGLQRGVGAGGVGTQFGDQFGREAGGGGFGQEQEQGQGRQQDISRLQKDAAVRDEKGEKLGGLQSVGKGEGPLPGAGAQGQGRGAQGWTGAEARGKPDDSVGGGWERPGQAQQWSGSDQLGYQGSAQGAQGSAQGAPGAQQWSATEQQGAQGGQQWSGAGGSGMEMDPRGQGQGLPAPTSGQGVAGEQATSRWTGTEQQSRGGGAGASASPSSWSDEKLMAMPVPELQNILRQKGALGYAGVTDKRQLISQIHALPNTSSS